MPWSGSVLSHSTKLAWKEPRKRERFLRGRHAKGKHQCITRCTLVWLCAMLPMWETLPEHPAAPELWEGRHQDTTHGPRSPNATLGTNWSAQHSQPPKQSMIESMTVAAEICMQWIREAPPVGTPETVQDPSPTRHPVMPLGTSRSMCVLCTLLEQHTAPVHGVSRCKDVTHMPLSVNAILGINGLVQQSQPPTQTLNAWLTAEAEISPQWIHSASPVGTSEPAQSTGPARHNVMIIGVEQSVSVMCRQCWHVMLLHTSILLCVDAVCLMQGRVGVA